MHYIDSLLRTDVFDFDQIGNMRAIQLVFHLLRERVGSPISYQSIAEDVGISPNTVKKYIQIFAEIDYKGEPYSLHYLRTKDGQEVDFALVKEENLEKILEVKQANKTISSSLKLFHNKYNLPPRKRQTRIRLRVLVARVDLDNREIELG
jgi:uncharacterized protein